jgi:hypothetical protein
MTERHKFSITAGDCLTILVIAFGVAVAIAYAVAL